MIRVIVAVSHHIFIVFRHFLIFPYDSLLGWKRLVTMGIKANIYIYYEELPAVKKDIRIHRELSTLLFNGELLVHG